MWEQTVKQVEWSPDGLIPASQVQSLLNLQAEISYKAGYKKASDESNAISHLDCYEDGKKAGMKEVVEWIWNHAVITGRDTDSHYDLQQVAFNYSLWQAFLNKLKEGAE